MTTLNTQDVDGRVKAYVDDHIAELFNFANKVMQERGELEPFFIMHLKSGGQVIFQLSQSDFVVLEDKIGLITIVKMLVATIEEIAMVSFVTGGYGMGAKEEDMRKEGIADPNLFYQHVQKKYGSISQSPYGIELVTIMGDCKEYSFVQTLPTVREGNKVSLKKEEPHIMALDNEDNLKMVHHGGYTSGVFNSGLMLRDMLGELVKQIMPAQAQSVRSLPDEQVAISGKVMAAYRDKVQLSDEWVEKAVVVLAKMREQINDVVSHSEGQATKPYVN